MMPFLVKVRKTKFCGIFLVLKMRNEKNLPLRFNSVNFKTFVESSSLVCGNKF